MWTERVDKQMIPKRSVDRPPLGGEQLRAAGGGFRWLDRTFEHRLEEVLCNLQDAVSQYTG